jgi:hypothetical protein
VGVQSSAKMLSDAIGLAIESTHTIEIDSFVPHAQIDQRFFDTRWPKAKITLR